MILKRDCNGLWMKVAFHNKIKLMRTDQNFLFLNQSIRLTLLLFRSQEIDHCVE